MGGGVCTNKNKFYKYSRIKKHTFLNISLYIEPFSVVTYMLSLNLKESAIRKWPILTVTSSLIIILSL